MDYADMVASLRRKEWREAQTAFDAVPDKLFWDPAEIDIKPEASTGTVPKITEFVEITKSMSQGNSMASMYR